MTPGIFLGVLSQGVGPGDDRPRLSPLLGLGKKPFGNTATLPPAAATDG
ncbi:hypothetical protein ACIRVF_05190 [Kitasatospora sp. NPDC101157]